MASAAKVEESLEMLASASGVLGVVVCTRDGVPIRDTFPDLDRTQAIQYASMAAVLAKDAHELASLESGGGLAGLRVRTRSIELHVKANAQYLLVVVQDPQPAI
uniref:Roadblock/LAMTOR2 domain-containing protein n=1 Tax=Neobodo designis TaxID=312471 RepID=A0A7S1QUT1_NEODS|mmetsp:Transcript_52558/g.161773  ORF Transcript_52558/g.161773 Transcript_52558/m.161773 type:complete len:104 (+) Transcript_52558:79-390(+)